LFLKSICKELFLILPFLSNGAANIRGFSYYATSFKEEIKKKHERHFSNYSKPQKHRELDQYSRYKKTAMFFYKNKKALTNGQGF
jgi:predicted butyrate kinase (DUF1464 family)